MSNGSKNDPWLLLLRRLGVALFMKTSIRNLKFPLQRVESLYSKIQVVVDYIKANLHQKLCLDELARPAKISRYRLCHLFKAEIGMSPGQYIQRLRMQEASVLLSTTLMSVKQIMRDRIQR